MHPGLRWDQGILYQPCIGIFPRNLRLLLFLFLSQIDPMYVGRTSAARATHAHAPLPSGFVTDHNDPEALRLGPRSHCQETCNQRSSCVSLPKGSAQRLLARLMQKRTHPEHERWSERGCPPLWGQAPCIGGLLR